MDGKRAEAFRILVVEDDLASREWLRRGLAKKGYEVTAANDGEEALDKARQSRFHLAIMDLVMPGMSGLETMEALKQVNPGIEVILVTGNASKDSALEAMKKGAFAYLIKPFEMMELEALLPGAYEKMSLRALVSLLEATRGVFADVELEELLLDLMSLARRILGAGEVSLLLKDSEGKLRVSVSSSPRAQSLRNSIVPLETSVAGRVAQWKTGVIINGPLSEDPRFKDLPAHQGVTYSLVYPIILKDELLGVLCANRGVEREKFQPQDLRHASIFCSQVAQAIENAKLYDKLTVARNEALKANALKDEFLYFTTHDLKNPLGIIQGFTEQLIKADDDPKLRKELGQRILHNVDNMLALIRQILKKGQLESGQFQLEKKPTPVGELLSETIRDFEVLAVKREITISKESGLKEGFLAEVDPEAFREILSNLIGNAIKYCEPGNKIKVSLESRDGVLTLKVADNGPGISEEDRRRLFQRFQRGAGGAKAEGTGIGLAIVKTLAEIHGGHVVLSSSPEQGSLFTVTLA